MLLAGCGKPHPIKPDAGKSDKETIAPAVGVGAGSVTVFAKPGNQRGYTIKWKRGMISASDPEHFSGTVRVNEVSGTVFRDDVPTLDFTADAGTADNKMGVLTLEGHVRVHAVNGNSLVKGATLTCDRMLYATADQIIKASGRVMAASGQFTIGPVPDAWCSNTLSQIASPSDFVPVRHNQPAPTHS